MDLFLSARALFPVEAVIPDFVVRHFPKLARTTFFRLESWQWVAIAMALGLALFGGFLAARLLLLLSRRLLRRPAAASVVDLVRATQLPFFAGVSLAIFDWEVDALDLAPRVEAIVTAGSRHIFVAFVAWLVIVGTASLTESYELRLSGADEFRSRGVRTQLRLAHHIFSALVVLASAALVLSSFQVVRNLGVSLLASAGIASVVLGFAAQKTLGTLLQGFQLSLAQPIRLGDTVVFDNEFGTIEEIQLTYVTVRLWDLRRLVVPVSRFLDQPFQNWTKVATGLLGSADLWVDYSAPIERIRAELDRACKASALWDGKICRLQVTDSTDRSMKLRCLVSATDASQLFDLRCEMREKMIGFLQSLDGGEHLPLTRNIDVSWLEPPASPAAPPAPKPPSA